MNTTGYDTSRAYIDALLVRGDKEAALVVAKRVFPRHRTLLDQAAASGNLDWFRELCAIPEGCEWVDGEFLPGPFRMADSGQPIMPSAVTPSQALPEPVDPADIVRAFLPLFTWVACIGGLVVFVFFIVSVAGSAVIGLSTGLIAAFTVVGQFLGYIIGIVLVGYLLLQAIRLKRNTVEYTEYQTVEKEKEQIIVNINSFNQNKL